MIISLGFSLNVEITGNMKNQRNPFSHNSEFVTSAQMYVLLTLRGQNASEWKFQKQTIFFWMSGVSFRMFRGFYEKRIFPIRKRMFAISPDRSGEKSDPNLRLEWRTKYDYSARLKGKRVRKTQKIIVVKTKQWILVWVSHYELKSRVRVVCITICHECSTHMFC